MNSIKTLIFIVLTCLFSSFGVTAQDFNVTYVPGQQYTSKPSISQRLQGTDEVVVLVPINQSKLDEYYYACIVNYFTRLGVPVRTCQVHFEKETKELGSTLAVWGSPTGYPSDFWIDVNTLVVTANYVSTFTSYIGEQAFGKIAITDIVNKFIWEFNFDMPNNEKKFDKVLKSLIASSYYKNNSARQINPHYKSNWTGEWKFKDYFNSNNYHPLEGVYDGDSYKVAVKQGNDGKFYLVYLSGKGNPKDWSVGDIKAILEPTAIPTVFKAKWYGRTKQTMDNTIIFKDGLMTTYDEDKEQEQFIKLYPALLSNQDANPTTWSGSGFALKKGYLVTNFHVIDGASSISIRGVKGDISKSYSATVVGSDKGNDLALLKITDSNFTGFGNIPYSISKSGTEVGEEIFVLGYPLTSTMGDEIKLTTGIVSSKTGFQGDVSLYQISAPIQQGNSGGPLFDK